MTTAFISKGQLYLLAEDGTPEAIHSAFASKQEREADKRQNNSPWAKEGDSSNAFGGVNVWGGHAAAARFTPYRCTEAIRLDENTLLYTLTNDTVTGLFEYDIAEKTERRLVHRNELNFQGMDYDAEGRHLCVGRGRESGAVDLEFIDMGGRTVKHITDGDSIDCNPAYSRKDPSVILFQSSGIARTEDGTFHSIGPAYVNRLNLQ